MAAPTRPMSVPLSINVTPAQNGSLFSADEHEIGNHSTLSARGPPSCPCPWHNAVKAVDPRTPVGSSPEESCLGRQTNSNEPRFWRLVLTGGPCAGKTTAQQRLATFFEGLGWKVYCIPETATMLIKGGVNFADLSLQDQFNFNEDLLIALLHNEHVFMRLGANCSRNCIVICDRGAMDPSAYMRPGEWEAILKKYNLNNIELRDVRYDQVVHLVTAAAGAEHAYTLANNQARAESAELSRQLDEKIKAAWCGHPYFDVVDNKNTLSFEDKMLKLLQVVCDRMNIEYGDRLAANSRRRRWLLRRIVDDTAISQTDVFDVRHDYLKAEQDGVQSRIRRRGHGRFFSYSITVRKLVNNAAETRWNEQRRSLSRSQYEQMMAFCDPARAPIVKRRRCFIHEGTYFQLDAYKSPFPPSFPSEYRHHEKIYILETYTSRTDSLKMPDWLEVEKEITDNPDWSMSRVSKRQHDISNFIDSNSC